jgi:hypothetical protein
MDEQTPAEHGNSLPIRPGPEDGDGYAHALVTRTGTAPEQSSSYRAPASEKPAERLVGQMFDAAMKDNSDPNYTGPWQPDGDRWLFDVDLCEGEFEPTGLTCRVQVSFARESRS